MTGFTFSAFLKKVIKADPRSNWPGLMIASTAGARAGNVRRIGIGCLVLTISLAAILVFTPVLRAVTEDLAPTAEQLTLGTSSGFGNLLSDDGLNWGGTEGVAGSSTQDYAPSTETITTGSKVSGTFPGDVSSSNDAYIRYQEQDTAGNPTDLTADSETLTKANSVSGALSDLNTNNGVPRVVSEQDQAVPSDLVPDTETINIGSAVSGTFPTDISSDNGVSLVRREADQTPSNLAVTIYPNADGYLNQWVTAGTPACDTTTPWYDEVDDGAVPDDDTTCRQAASNAQIIAVNMQDVAITGSPTDVDVCARGYFADDVAGANTVRILIRSSTTNSFSGTYNPPNLTPYTASPWFCLDTDPSTSADWTDAGVDAMQVGADTPDANPDPRVTQFEAKVWANYTAGTDYELTVTYDHTGPESCSGTRTLTVNAWRVSGASMENVEVYMATSAEAFSNLAFTVSATADGTTYTHVLTDDEWDSGLPNFRFIDTTTSGDSAQGDLSVDYAVIQCLVSDFELEYRNAFTGETCAAPNTRVLTVNAWRSTGGMEDTYVQVEDGSDTGTYATRITVTQTTDTATQTYTLLDAEWDLGDVQIRMLGSVEAGDTSQGEFSMDYVVVQCTPPISYQVEVRYDWGGVLTAGTSWTLIVECKRVANPEDALIQVGTFPGPSWNTRYICNQNVDTTYSTYALTAGELNSGAPSVRVLYNATGDSAQSSWDLDWVTVRRAFNYYGLTQFHKWVGTVAVADAYQYRVRALRSDTENFLAAFWDWEDSDWNPTAVTVNAAAETLFTYTPATVCGAGADNCERNAGNGTMMVRWVGSSETSSDETQSTLTADQEIVQRTDNAPSLSGAYHIPANPTDAQTVTFRVNYTDSLTCPATYVNVAVDGGLDQAMNEFDPGDLDCSDFKIYTLTLGPYAAGSHFYFFNASDGANPEIEIGPYFFTATSSNSPPTLTGPGHAPANPDDTQTVDFTVTYTDADAADCPPTYIKAFINGDPVGQDMTEVDPLDLDCTDGKQYVLTDGPFEAGAHTYSFEASDGTDVASIGPFPFTVTATGGQPPGGHTIHGIVADFSWTGWWDAHAEFRDASISDRRRVSWLWDFGDGTTSTEENPEHAYALDTLFRVYHVTLLACNDDRVCDTVGHDVLVLNGWLLLVLGLLATAATWALARTLRRATSPPAA